MQLKKYFVCIKRAKITRPPATIRCRLLGHGFVTYAVFKRCEAYGRKAEGRPIFL